MNPLRRRSLHALAAILTMLPVAAQGQRQARRVFWFPNNWPSAQQHDAIRKAIAAAGHAEWRGVDLSFHDVDTADLRQMVADRPDAIVMMGNHRLSELGQLTREIPVVFYNLSHDPVRVGIVESLRKPGKNFTGTVIQWDEIATKYWQLLKDVRPSMKCGAVLLAKEDLDGVGGRDPILRQELEALLAVRRAAATNLGIEIREIFISRNASASDVAQAVRKAGAEALEIGLPLTPEQLSLVVQARIPTAGYSFGAVRKGMRLIGISFRWDEGENEAIAMVARILRGESPATIPVYRTRSYGIAVNMKLAREMGIEIPPSILIQAVEVVR